MTKLELGEYSMKFDPHCDKWWWIYGEVIHVLVLCNMTTIVRQLSILLRILLFISDNSVNIYLYLRSNYHAIWSKAEYTCDLDDLTILTISIYYKCILKILACIDNSFKWAWKSWFGLCGHTYHSETINTVIEIGYNMRSLSVLSIRCSKLVFSTW